MNLELQELYQRWQENNVAKLRSNQFEILNSELFTNPEQDQLRGLNIIGFFEDSIHTNVDKLLEKIFTATPALKTQWIIPQPDRHITILDIAPHNSGLDKDQVQVITQRFQPHFEEIMKEARIIEILFKGLLISPNGITLTGFPTGESLAQLRSQLRSALDEDTKGLELNKYKVITAHMALIKFTDGRVLANTGNQLLELVEQFRDYTIPATKLSRITLNISGRYDKSKTNEIISERIF
jgi:hypothetical protein